MGRLGKSQTPQDRVVSESSHFGQQPRRARFSEETPHNRVGQGAPGS
jgi:hypothetical protein